MMKQADLNDVMSGLSERASEAGGALKGWYGGLNPDVKSTILRALAGAAAGGVAGKVMDTASSDPEAKRTGISPALLGAILGGTGAAALPLGLKMMGNGGIQLRDEGKRPAALRAIEAPGDFAMNHPLAVGLPAAATYSAATRGTFGNLRNAMSHTEAMGGALANTAAAGATEAALAKADAAAASAPFAKRLGSALTNGKYWAEPRGADFKPLGSAAVKQMAIHGGHGINAGRGRLALMPLALMAGLAGDKYLKGQW